MRNSGRLFNRFRPQEETRRRERVDVRGQVSAGRVGRAGQSHSGRTDGRLVVVVAGLDGLGYRRRFAGLDGLGSRRRFAGRRLLQHDVRYVSRIASRIRVTKRRQYIQYDDNCFVCEILRVTAAGMAFRTPALLGNPGLQLRRLLIFSFLQNNAVNFDCRAIAVECPRKVVVNVDDYTSCNAYVNT